MKRRSMEFELKYSNAHTVFRFSARYATLPQRGIVLERGKFVIIINYVSKLFR